MASIYRRGKIWWGRVYVGHEFKKSLRTTSRIAAKRRLKAWAEELEDQRWAGRRYKYSEALETFLNEYQVKANTMKRYRVSARMLWPYLQDRWLDEINKRRIGEIVSGRKGAGASNATIRRDLTFLSRVCALAATKDWIEQNPIPGYDKSVIRERRAPILYPSDVAVREVVSAATGMAADLILFLEQSGLRQEEAVSLTWLQVNLKRAEATLYNTKGGATRTVSLSGTVLGTLRKLPRRLRTGDETDWVFWRPSDGYRFTQFSSLFSRVARKAGVKMRCHDLRHKYARDWLRAGKDIYALQKQLGHKSIKTTEIYLGSVGQVERRRGEK